MLRHIYTDERLTKVEKMSVIVACTCCMYMYLFKACTVCQMNGINFMILECTFNAQFPFLCCSRSLIYHLKLKIFIGSTLDGDGGDVASTVDLFPPRFLILSTSNNRYMYVHALPQ